MADASSDEAALLAEPRSRPLSGLEDKERDMRLCRTTVSFWNVVVMGVSLLLLFTAYNSAQMLQSPTQPRSWIGAPGVGLTFASYSVMSLFSANVIERLGEKNGLFAGSGALVFYMVVNLLLSKFTTAMPLAVYVAIYWVASVVNGIGSSLLWTSQGSLITLMAKPETLGHYNGVCVALFMGNFVIGGLTTQFVLGCGDGAGQPLTLLYLIFSALAIAGAAVFFLIRVTPSLMPSGLPLSWSPKKTLVVLIDRRFLYMYPTMMYSGFSSAFYMVVFTAFMGKCFLGYAQIVLGVAEVLGCIVAGKLSDRIGRTPLFLVGCGCTAVAAVIVTLSDPMQTTIGPGEGGNGAWVYFLAFCMYGLGDAAFNTQTQSVLGLFFNEKAASAFAAYRIVLALFGGLASSVGFTFLYLGRPWDLLVPCIILWCILSVSVVCWLYLDKRVQAVSPPSLESVNA